MQHPPTDYADAIIVRGARTNNLRGVDLDVPKRRLIVITGVSGSGKSSLAFDTIAAESQRLLTETYPAFLQNQLPHAPRPDADELRNLTATIAVTQRPMAGSPRSTVGTATDAITLLRQLFAAHGSPAVGSPQELSFNSPRGACAACEGSGTEASIDEDALLDPALSLDAGALRFPNFGVGSLFWKVYARSGYFDTSIPIERFTDEQRTLLLHGTGPSVDTGSHPMAYEGVVRKIRRLYLSKAPGTLKPALREALAAIASVAPCSDCEGTRLADPARRCLIGGRSIADAAAEPADRLDEWLAGLDLPPRLHDLRQRVRSIVRGMQHLGLGYLALERPTGSLSGGEAQRIRTVMHLDSALTELTYVFDEPAAGLHAHDTSRVIDLLRRLRDKGNTVIAVEHHPAVIRAADHVIDIGPGAGRDGGTVLFEGPPAELVGADGPTARALSAIPTLTERPRALGTPIVVRGARRNNLRSLDLDIPTRCLVVVTGVAGAGKTSLLRSIPRTEGLVALDQSPIRGSRRSSIATYTGALDGIRARFARENGVAASLFSPNGAGGCSDCGGLGVIVTPSAAGDDLTTTCGVCDGKRFSPDVLKHRVEGLSIDEMLDLPASEAATVLDGDRAGGILQRVTEVGIGYIAIGQPLTQLSGGERQRLRLATELRQTASTYLLDEPTTGLHHRDVETLVALLSRLVDDGASVIVADHHLHLIAAADHLIELGPGAGTAGGRLCFEGPPARIIEHGTPTGEALRAALDAGKGDAPATQAAPGRRP